MGAKPEQDFIELVQRAEKEAEDDPRGYVIRLALFALLGYGVIFLVLFALIGLAGGLVAMAFLSTAAFLILLKKKLIFLVAIGIWVLLRALWVRFSPPEGTLLERDEFPELFAELDELSARLDSLRIHRVILDNSLNAAVVQHPRLGVLGWYRNYLILGYQLLLVLSPDEMRSVLAHEMGHLSGNHSRFNGWIYRVRLSWLRVMHAFDEVDSIGGSLMRRFFDWYSPQFEAYSFALARNNEYEADAIAAELTSPEIATRALVSVHTLAPHVDRSYWDRYFELADERERPPYPPFEGLKKFIGENPMTREAILDSIRAEMARETHYADTHPSLGDRVAALAAKPQMPGAPEVSAADAWLGENSGRVMADLDREWLDEHGESWRERYEYATDAKRRLQTLAEAEADALEDQDLWNLAYWTWEFETDEAALPRFMKFLERYPEDRDAAFYSGRILLQMGDAAGLEYLRVARQNANYTEAAARFGWHFLKETGRDADAETWWKESVELRETHLAAQAERASVAKGDKLESPEIDDALLEKLTGQLRSFKRIRKAWLAQKVVKHYPEHPVYIVAFEIKGWLYSAKNAVNDVSAEIEFPDDMFVVCRAGDYKPLAKEVIKSGRRIL